MNPIQVLSLLLALSFALNTGFVAGFTARCAGASLANALLVGGGAVGSMLALYLTAVSAYQ